MNKIILLCVFIGGYISFSYAQNDACREFEEQCPYGAGAACNTGGVSSRVKEFPGQVCVMNVGTLRGNYNNKVPNCDGLTNRVDALRGMSADCDSVSIIELNSNAQCICACGMARTALERAVCETNNWGSDTERCLACRGCNEEQPGPGSCEKQAEVICPPDQYDINCRDGAPREGGMVMDPIGCDCTCKRKGPCTLTGGTCTPIKVTPTSLVCSKNNFATCFLCDNAPYGPSTAYCTMHPDHCDGYSDLGFNTKEQCLEQCSRGLVANVLDRINGYDIKTLAGDWNCGINRDCHPFGHGPRQCTFLDITSAAGLELCASAPYRYSTLLPNCDIDFVLSNHCGCSSPSSMDFSQHYWPLHLYDHPTLVYGFRPEYSLLDDQIIEAHSQVTYDGITQTDPRSDGLGSSCGANGNPIASCTATGSTSRGMLRFGRYNECPSFYERFRPRVMACDTAWAGAHAESVKHGSAATSVRTTLELATANATASCSGDCDQSHLPPMVTAAKTDQAFPIGNLLVTTRIWSRERQASAQAPRLTPRCVELLQACTFRVKREELLQCTISLSE